MRIRANRPRGSSRDGLAPLEMVLALPILIIIMAFIINVGTGWAWKVRGLSVARHVAWSHRTERGMNQRPPYWPDDAGMSAGSPGPVESLSDPRVDHPVVRGPMLGTIAVRRDLLDPANEELRGNASMSRKFPLLRQMPEYHLRAHAKLLHNKWQFRNMGLDHNNERRTDEPEGDPLYRLPDFPDLRMAHFNAMNSLCNYWNYERELEVLDREPEFRQYAQNLFASGGGYRDYHPRVGFCTLERSDVDEKVEDLIDRIQGRPEEGDEKEVPNLAERMTGSFVGYYKGVLRKIERGREDIMEGRETDAIYWNWGAINAEEPIIKQKLADLEKYQQTLEALP